jgi:DNA-binding NarL/FixJ family response regulator
MTARTVRLVGGRGVLSQREIVVLFLVARGLANRQVARELGVTESAFQRDVCAIPSKLGVTSPTQLALYVARNGVVALGYRGSEAADGKHHVPLFA